jgi:alpha-D-ribose 1-methylphosphonate 5-triphosphate synthase subunit PhnH
MDAINLVRELDLSHLRPGFVEPVRDAQRCFRGVLDALARPGHVVELVDLPEPPAGLGAAQSAVLLALADTDTPVWLPPALRDAEAGHYLRFHCGCRLATKLANAHFVVPAALTELPALDELRLGDPAFPDRSATLIVEVAGLEAGGPSRQSGVLRLSGPGIETEAHLSVAGWRTATTDFLRENRRRFPLGVDLLLTCGSRVAGLPRTVHIASEN